MATIDEIRKNRLRKLKAIESAGFLVYRSEENTTDECEQVLKDYIKHASVKR